MTNGFDIIVKLTKESLNSKETERLFKDFSRVLEWEPSDRLDPDEDLSKITNGHLIVEHGLEQSAVITFLKQPIKSISIETFKKILSISYNNLIDWHIYVEPEQFSTIPTLFFYNRSNNPKPIIKEINRHDTESLKSTMFEQITNVKINPNFPALDDLLIENISFWKRNLAAEVKKKINLIDYSTLFNAVIFARAIEDLNRKINPNEKQVLLNKWEKLSNNGDINVSIKKIIELSIKEFIKGKLPQNLTSLNKLKKFNQLNSKIIYDFLASFYKSRKIPYSYDFAIMSKHALSRIYEHYVSILRFDNKSIQLYFFPPSLPKEEQNKSYGSVYTPQFIARFFARYIREQYPPRIFRNLEILDPACGSGIFLRTMLEFQCAPYFDYISSQEIKETFTKVMGIDLDQNAILATSLSLSLLYLVLMGGHLPNKMKIFSQDALDYIVSNKNIKGKLDVVVQNPPFVPYDLQKEDVRRKIKNYLGDLAHHKPDLYIAFIKMAIEFLKDGGYAMFVLPHSFLKTSSAEGIREYIFHHCWIRVIVDLSVIPVFKDKGTYTILLILQKKFKQSDIQNSNKTSIVICQEFVGHALYDFLNNKKVENNFYSIYDIDQNIFQKNDWTKALIPPSQQIITKKVSKFETLKTFLKVKQGIVTGADNVFIINKIDIPITEHEIWRPLLRDRDMLRYVVPKSTDYYIFYPVIKGKKLSDYELRIKYPLSWKYLVKNKSKLPIRKQKERFWWLPVSLRDPNILFSSKIVTPHLVLFPRFSLDIKGIYAITRSPYLVLKEDNNDNNFLKFFLAVLNSNIFSWLVSTHSDKYSHGYARLEVKTLSSIPIPDPSKIDIAILNRIIKNVDLKLNGNINIEIDKELNDLIAEIYQITKNEKLSLGFEN